MATEIKLSLTSILKTPVSDSDTKATLSEKLTFLVDEYNKATQFSEHKKVAKIDTATKEVLAKLATIAQNDCFVAIKKTAKKNGEDPMRVAAKTLRYAKPIVRDEDEVGEDGKPTDRQIRVIKSGEGKIDPLRLHKTLKDGIGARKDWFILAKKLESELFAANCEAFGAVTTDGKTATHDHIIATYKMKEESRVFALGTTLPQMVLTTIKAMIGEVDIADDRLAQLTEYLVRLHSKSGKGALTVKGTMESNFRYRLLEVCDMALTGANIVAEYKEKK